MAVLGRGEAIGNVEGASFVEDDNSPRANIEERAVVGREQHSDPRRVDVLEEAEHVDRKLRIEIARGLIGQNHRGLSNDGASQTDALPLPAGKRSGAIGAAACEPDALERLADATIDEASRQPEYLERQRHVVADGPGVDELEVLEDNADVPSQIGDARGRKSPNLASEKQDPSLVDGLGGVEELEQGALARAARSGDEDEFPSLDGERKATQYWAIAAEGFVDLLEDHDGPVGRIAIKAVASPQKRSKTRAGRTGEHGACVTGTAKKEQLFGVTEAPAASLPDRDRLSSFRFMTTPLRIGFFGLPLAALLLKADGHNLAWTVLAPVAQPGRRRLASRLPESPCVDLLEEGVGASWQTAVDELLGERPVDLIVSWFFTRRIRGEWIASASQGAIGAHPSLLPRYRGPDPFYAVIDAGETLTGVTVHRLTAEYDEGAILMQRTLEVGERNAWQLARALDRPSLATLREVTHAFAEGRPPRGQDQNPAQITLAPTPAGDGLRVDWTWPTCRVMQRIRALSPIPGLALELAGQAFLVTEARPCDDYPRALAPGEAFLGERLVLRTGDGAISVERAALEVDEDEEPVIVGGARLRTLLALTREKLELV